MMVSVSSKSSAQFSNVPLLNSYYRCPAHQTASSYNLSYGKTFNTLGVTVPVRIPRPLSENYSRNKSSLPIYKHKYDFLNALSEHPVLIVSAEQSSEKSTQIPQFILEEASEKGSYVRIICTQHSQLSISYSAARVAEDRGEPLGTAVGSQIKLKFQYGMTSGLIYCSNEIVLNTLMHHNKHYLSTITHVIIDDVQEHDPYCELLLVVLKEHLKTNNNLKVILITTENNVEHLYTFFKNPRVQLIRDIKPTVNRLFLEDVLEAFYIECSLELDNGSLFETVMNKCLKFQDDCYFDVLLHLIYSNNNYVNKKCKNGFTPLTLVSLTGRCHMVKLFTSLGAKVDNPEEDMTENNNNIDVALITKIIIHIHKRYKGNTLIFLPSYESLIYTKESLLLSLPMDVEDYDIILIYETTDHKVYKKSLDQSKDKHKIILATVAAEGSLVIPNVTHVIDTGKIEHQSGINSWISQRAATERAYKAASNGICFHLYTHEFYKKCMKKDKTPKIQETMLHAFCLRIKALSTPTSNINDFFQLLPKPPLQKNVNTALKDLMILGALNADTELTVLGRLLTELTVEPRFAKMLVYAVIFKCLDPILTIVACLCYKNPIVIPHDTSLEDVKEFQKYCGSFQSDHLLLLRIYQDWQKSKASKKDISLDDRCINWHAMEIVHEIRADLLSQLRGVGFVNLQVPGKTKELNENSERWPMVKAVLTAGCYSNIHFIQNKDLVSFSKSTAMSSLSLHDNLCVVYEKALKTESKLHIQFGTVVTPLTVALMYHYSNIKTQSDESNIKMFSVVLKQIISKKVANPVYVFNRMETDILTLARDSICAEELDYHLPQPHGIGAMPKIFISVRPKSTQQQLFELYGKHGFKMEDIGNAIQPETSLEVSGLYKYHKSVFFIVIAPSYKYFYDGVITKEWTFSQQTEKKILLNLKERNLIKIFFSVTGSKYFQGVAQLVDFGKEYAKEGYTLSWISIKTVSFETIWMMNLKNGYDNDRLVSEGEDGQQVEYGAALQLYNAFL